MSPNTEVLNTVDNGLDGVPVCTSDISLTTVDKDGNPILLYRGYSIYDLIQGPFEETVHLILHGTLPNGKELNAFKEELSRHAKLDEPILSHLRSYPENVHMMDLLMTSLSFARMWDADYTNSLWQTPKMDEELARLLLNAGVRLGAKIPALMTAGWRIRKGMKPIEPDPRLPFAGNILHMLDIQPEPELVDALNTILILYLDHTINCSTFAALVVESSMTDPYTPLIAAGAPLKGVRHGGANELAAMMFEEIGTPDRAQSYIMNKLNNGELVFGFGHRLPHYKHKKESRVTIAERIGRPLAQKKGMGHLFEIYDIIGRVMLKEKDRAPNADLPICILLKLLGIPRELNTPIFQASRHFGWLANILRQRRAKGPLFRPTQEYTGPDIDAMRTYVPLEKR
ncbi:citrate/2-methylcitrate synthase [Nitrospina gracilis]|uniref:citrate/2-methylcitrate synthase n=1 Tax=Nitrospina gracilis TaxID=35801 RepID=UPI001F1BFA62|nr:citrate/2-methylcitrate synthase [Nitrospina gracilis]MCF8721625.1 citrate synthase [Nitrospina gracilis Nb-211]